MKWSVLILTVVGVVAALCAAVLVAVMTSGKGNGVSKNVVGEMKTIVAVNALPANTPIKAEDIGVRVVKAKTLDPSVLVDESQAIGRITAMPISKGQQLTSQDILAAGSTAALVSAIPVNQRVVGVSLTDDRRIAGLLYPGCMVDVLVSFDVAGGWMGADQLSTTLLSNVKVLGIEDRLLTTTAPASEDSKQNKNPHKVVYLLVDTQQAEKLNLVRDRCVSLALRSPLDKEPSQNGFAWMSDDAREYYYRIGKTVVEKLRKSGKSFFSITSLAALGVSGNAPAAGYSGRSTESLASLTSGQGETAPDAAFAPPATVPPVIPVSVPRPAPPPATASSAAPSAFAEPAPQWTVTVIRAGAPEVRVFAMPGSGEEGGK